MVSNQLRDDRRLRYNQLFFRFVDLIVASRDGRKIHLHRPQNLSSVDDNDQTNFINRRRRITRVAVDCIAIKSQFNGLLRAYMRALSSTTAFVVNPRDLSRLNEITRRIQHDWFVGFFFFVLFVSFLSSLIFFTTYRRPSRRRNHRKLRLERFCVLK